MLVKQRFVCTFVCTYLKFQHIQIAMNITIRPYLNKRKKKKDGTIPIYVRLTKDRKSRYLSVGISLEEKFWDSSNREVKKSHRFAKKYNQEIKKLVNELEAKYFEIKDETKLDTRILKESVAKTNRRTVLNYAREYREKLKDDKRFWEWKKFGTIIEDLEEFFNGTDLLISDMDSGFIEKFQGFLLYKKEKRNNEKTTRRKLTSFKGFIDKLIKNEEIKHDPFLKAKLVTPKPSDKTRLSFDQINAIKELDLAEKSGLWHTRNFFLYSFLNAGIRFSDLCTLTWKNIIDGRLIYKMHKTGGGKSIRQLEEHNRILAYYRSEDSEPDDYIFPILRNKHTDPMELRREISSRNVVVNKQLKEIAKQAGIQTNVSFHVARHSFSQYALTKGMDVYSISKALGHSDIETTQQYLNSFDEDLLDKSMDKLFGDS